jgi:hypothetical protein
MDDDEERREERRREWNKEQDQLEREAAYREHKAQGITDAWLEGVRTRNYRPFHEKLGVLPEEFGPGTGLGSSLSDPGTELTFDFRKGFHSHVRQARAALDAATSLPDEWTSRWHRTVRDLTPDNPRAGLVSVQQIMTDLVYVRDAFGPRPHAFDLNYSAMRRFHGQVAQIQVWLAELEAWLRGAAS